MLFIIVSIALAALIYGGDFSLSPKDRAGGTGKPGDSPRGHSSMRALPPGESRDQGDTPYSPPEDFRENSIKGVPHIDIDSYTLEVSGLVAAPRSYRYEELIGRPSVEKALTLYCVEGWNARALWTGIPVKELIAGSAALPGARTVIFHAADGFTTSFPLDYVLGRELILAYRMNGKPLAPERGFPFQLVAGDAWGYKWARWVTRIELSGDAEYRGYWESRGYSNEGSLDRDFLEQ